MIDVLRVLADLGIDYRVSGDEATACCPNPKHHDRSPSWSVNLDSGKHNCLSCGFCGPLVRLVRTLRNVGEDQAELYVRTRSSSRLRGSPDREEAPERDDRPRVTEASLALFTDPPRRELERRMIYADAAAQLGILWDADERAWILPFRDAAGKLHGWQAKETRGKKLVRNHPTGIKKSEFLFGLHAADPGTGVLVESPLDTARLRSAGVRGGVASYGVRVSRVQRGLLAAHFDRVIAALDDDRAGWEVSEQLRKEFHSVPLSFFNYDAVSYDAPADVVYHKDPGTMSDFEIEACIEQAIPSLLARF
jgi:hypothetical protein